MVVAFVLQVSIKHCHNYFEAFWLVISAMFVFNFGVKSLIFDKQTAKIGQLLLAVPFSRQTVNQKAVPYFLQCSHF